MSIADKYLLRYVLGAFSYGLLRKVDDVAYATITIREWDNEARQYFDRRVPMLFADRFIVAGLSTLAAPLLLPKYLYDDLSAIEIRIRNADPADYNRNVRRTVLQYLF